MAKATKHCYVSVENPDDISGYSSLTVGQWLTRMMEKQNLSNKEMNYRLAKGGYRPADNFISNIRNDHSKIPESRIPLVVGALGLNEPETRYWVEQIMRAYLPDTLHPHIVNWTQVRAQQILALLRGAKGTARP
jgi:hypothetical protein